MLLQIIRCSRLSECASTPSFNESSPKFHPTAKDSLVGFVRRKTIGNEANNSKFTRLSEEDFPKAKGQIKLFQFLLLDDNFPTTNITPAKSTPHQTLPQSLQNSITIINSQPRKHTKINKGANLANCVPSEEFVPKYCIN